MGRNFPKAFRERTRTLPALSVCFKAARIVDTVDEEPPRPPRPLQHWVVTLKTRVYDLSIRETNDIFTAQSAEQTLFVYV